MPNNSLGLRGPHEPATRTSPAPSLISAAHTLTPQTQFWAGPLHVLVHLPGIPFPDPTPRLTPSFLADFLMVNNISWRDIEH